MDTMILKVGISDIKIGVAPNIIKTTGLGSCVGVVIYDIYKQIAGMAHVMLPDNALAKTSDYQPGKYANTAIESMLCGLKKHQLRPTKFEAKIAGGAEMFQLTRRSNLMRIGPRNVDVVKDQLKKYNIPLVGEDTGGNKGRTIEFFPESGMLSIRTVNEGVKTI